MGEFDTDDKGVSAESAIRHAATLCQLGVYEPLSSHSRARPCARAEDEIDLLAIYCGDLNRSFLLRASLIAGMRSIQLRLTPPRNNQVACINLADEFAFEGAVAQLGEHSAGSRKVRGSSPLSSTSSTSSEPAPISVGSNPFRDRLGYWTDIVAAGQEVIVTRRGRPRLRLASR